ncbi:MAG: hypothetical protein L3K03_07220 [Thermoplasmata archaeon]|nr:hypothetical protein [Thermoplasmata archaeon]
MGRHAALLADRKVRSWWEARSLRSRLSADTYLRQFGFLLEKTDLDPAKIVSLAKADPDALRDRLVRYAAQMKKEGRLDSYISKFFEGLKSYLRFHRVAFDGFPSLSPIKGESLATERVPTPEELAGVLEHLSIRGRVAALFMAHSGVRPSVLGSYQAESGLTLGDLPDLKLGNPPAFAEVPFVVRVPAHLSKTRAAYVTFGSSQLAATFLAYLTERREGGESLTPASPVLSVRSTRGVAERRRADPRYARGFVVTKAVVQEIHDALKSSAPDGVRWRPYVLRAYCSSRLLMAEGAGKMTRDLREAILGHDLGISGRYTLGKRWGEETLRDARASFKRAEAYLSPSSRSEVNGDEAVGRALKILLLARGVPEKTLAGLDLTGKDDEQLKEIVRNLGAAAEPARPAERAVSVADMPALLDAGYSLVAMNDRTAVVRAPASSPSSTAPGPRAAEVPAA